MPPSDASSLVHRELSALLAARGPAPSFDETTPLSEIGFRSIDFAELALAIEERSGRELDFDAVELDRVDTVGDVTRYFDTVLDSG